MRPLQPAKPVEQMNPEFTARVFACRECEDRAYVQAEPIRRHGIEYSTVRPCGSCEAGQAIIRGHKKRKLKRLAKAQKDAAAIAARENDEIPF